MGSRVRRVVTVDEILEGMRDVAFEGKILNRYGNFDSEKVTEFKYLHCDLIDKDGFTTVTLSIKQDQMREHNPKLGVGQVIRVENFGVSKKSKKGHKKGDLLLVLKAITSTIVTLLEPIPLGFKPEFYHTDSIDEYRSRLHKSWACATIDFCVIVLRDTYVGKYGSLFQVLVADGCSEKDHDVLTFTDQFRAEYEQVVEAFRNGLCVLVYIIF